MSENLGSTIEAKVELGVTATILNKKQLADDIDIVIHPEINHKELQSKLRKATFEAKGLAIAISTVKFGQDNTLQADITKAAESITMPINLFNISKNGLSKELDKVSKGMTLKLTNLELDLSAAMQNITVKNPVIIPAEFEFTEGSLAALQTQLTLRTFALNADLSAASIKNINTSVSTALQDLKVPTAPKAQQPAAGPVTPEAAQLVANHEKSVVASGKVVGNTDKIVANQGKVTQEKEKQLKAATAIRAQKDASDSAMSSKKGEVEGKKPKETPGVRKTGESLDLDSKDEAAEKLKRSLEAIGALYDKFAAIMGHKFIMTKEQYMSIFADSPKFGQSAFDKIIATTHEVDVAFLTMGHIMADVINKTNRATKGFDTPLVKLPTSIEEVIKISRDYLSIQEIGGKNAKRFEENMVRAYTNGREAAKSFNKEAEKQKIQAEDRAKNVRQAKGDPTRIAQIKAEDPSKPTKFESVSEQLQREKVKVERAIKDIVGQYNTLEVDYKKTLMAMKKSPGMAKTMSAEASKMAVILKQMKKNIDQGFTFDMTLTDSAGNAFQKMTSTYDKGAKVMSSVSNSVRASIGAMTGGFKNMIKRIALYGGGATLFYGLARAMKVSIKVIDEFEMSMAKMRMIMDTSKTNFDALGKAAFGLGKKYATGVKNVTDAMVVFAQQGRTQDEIIALTETSLLAANVTTLKAKEATDFLTAAIKQFGMEASESITILDKWSAVASKNAVTARVLAEATKQVGVAAKLSGLDMDKFNGIITAISAATRKTGKEIGTSMRFMLRHFKMDKGIKALQDVGVAVFAAGSAFGNVGTSFRSTGKVISELAKKWSDLSDVQQENIAHAIGGRRHYNTVKILMQNWDDVVKAQTDSQNSWGSAMTKNETVMATFSKTIETIKLQFQEFAVAMGGANGGLVTLLDMLKVTVNIAGGAVDVITTLISPFKGLATAAGGAMFALMGFNVALSRMGFEGGVGKILDNMKKKITAVGGAATKTGAAVAGMDAASMAGAGATIRKSGPATAFKKFTGGTNIRRSGPSVPIKKFTGLPSPAKPFVNPATSKAMRGQAMAIKTFAKSSDVASKSTGRLSKFMTGAKDGAIRFGKALKAAAASPFFKVALVAGAVVGIIKLVQSYSIFNDEADRFIKSSKAEIDAINQRISASGKLIAILNKEEAIRKKLSKKPGTEGDDRSADQLKLIEKITAQYPQLIAGYTKYGKAILKANFLLDDGTVNIEKLKKASGTLNLDDKIKKANIQLTFIKKLFKDIEGNKGIFSFLGSSDVEDLQEAHKATTVLSEGLKNLGDGFDPKKASAVFGKIKEHFNDSFATSTVAGFLGRKGELREYLHDKLKEHEGDTIKYTTRLRAIVGKANATISNVIGKLGGGEGFNLLINRNIKKGGPSIFKKFYDVQLANARNLFSGAGAEQKSVQAAFINMFSKFIPDRRLLSAIIKKDIKGANEAVAIGSLSFDMEKAFSKVIAGGDFGELENIAKDFSKKVSEQAKGIGFVDIGKIFEESTKGSDPSINKDKAFEKVFLDLNKNRFILIKRIGKEGKETITKAFVSANGDIIDTVNKNADDTFKKIKVSSLKGAKVATLKGKSDKPDGRFLVDMTKRVKLMESMIGLLTTQIGLIDRYNALLKENFQDWKMIHSIGSQTSDSIESLADMQIATAGGIESKVNVAAPIAREMTITDLSFGEMEIDNARNKIALDFLAEVTDQFKGISDIARDVNGIGTDFFDKTSKVTQSLIKDFKRVGQISGLKINVDKLFPSKASVKKKAKEIVKFFNSKDIKNIISIATPLGGGPDKRQVQDKSADLAKQEAINAAIKERSDLELKSLGKMISSYDVYIDRLKDAENIIGNKLARTRDPLAMQLLSAKQLVFQIKRQRAELDRNRKVQQKINLEFSGQVINASTLSTKLESGFGVVNNRIVRMNNDWGKLSKSVGITFKDVQDANLLQGPHVLKGKELIKAQVAYKKLIGLVSQLNKLRVKSSKNILSGTGLSDTKKQMNEFDTRLSSATNSLGQILEKVRKIKEEAKKMRVEALKSFSKAFTIEVKDMAIFSDAGLRTIGARFSVLRGKINKGIESAYGKNTKKARMAKERFFQELSKPLPFSSASVDKMFIALAKPARYKKFFKATTNVSQVQLGILEKFLKKGIDLGLDFEKKFPEAFQSAGLPKDIISPETLKAIQMFGGSLKEVRDTINQTRLSSHFEKMNIEISKLDGQMAVYGQSWQHLDKTISSFRSTLDGIINKSVELAGSWEKVDETTKVHVFTLAQELKQLEEIKLKNDLIKDSFMAVGGAIKESLFSTKGKSFSAALTDGLKKVREAGVGKVIDKAMKEIAAALSSSGSAETKKFNKARATALKLEDLVAKFKEMKLTQMNKKAADLYVDIVTAGFKRISEKQASKQLVGEFRQETSGIKKGSKQYFETGERGFDELIRSGLLKDLKADRITKSEFISQGNKIRKTLADARGTGVRGGSFDMRKFFTKGVMQDRRTAKLISMLNENFKKGADSGSVLKSFLKMSLRGSIEAYKNLGKSTKEAITLGNIEFRKILIRLLGSKVIGGALRKNFGIKTSIKDAKALLGKRELTKVDKSDLENISNRSILSKRASQFVENNRTGATIKDKERAGKMFLEKEGRRLGSLYSDGKMSYKKFITMLDSLTSFLKSGKVKGIGINKSTFTSDIRDRVISKAKIDRTNRADRIDSTGKVAQRKIFQKAGDITQTSTKVDIVNQRENETKLLLLQKKQNESEISIAKSSMKNLMLPFKKDLSFKKDSKGISKKQAEKDRDKVVKKQEEINRLKSGGADIDKKIKDLNTFKEIGINKNTGIGDLLTGQFGKGAIGKESAGKVFDKFSELSQGRKGSVLTLNGESKGGFSDKFGRGGVETYGLLSKRVEQEKSRINKVRADLFSAGQLDDTEKDKDKKTAKDREIEKIKAKTGFSDPKEIERYEKQLNGLNKELKDGAKSAGTAGKVLSAVFSVLGAIALEKGKQAVFKGIGGAAAQQGNKAIRDDITKRENKFGSESAQLGKEVGGAVGKGVGTAIGGPIGGAIGEVIGEIGGMLVGSLFTSDAEKEMMNLRNNVKDASMDYQQVMAELGASTQELQNDFAAFSIAISPIKSQIANALTDFGATLTDGAVKFFDSFDVLNGTGGFVDVEGFSDKAFTSATSLARLGKNASNLSEVFGIFSSKIKSFELFRSTDGGTGKEFNVGAVADLTFRDLQKDFAEILNKETQISALDNLITAESALTDRLKENASIAQRNADDKDHWFATQEDANEERMIYIKQQEHLNGLTAQRAALEAEINELLADTGEKMQELSNQLTGFATSINDMRTSSIKTAAAWDNVVASLEYNLGGISLDDIIDELIGGLGTVATSFISGFDNSLFDLDSVSIEGLKETLRAGSSAVLATTGVALKTVTGEMVALMGKQITSVASLSQEVAGSIGDKSVGEIIKLYKEYQHEMISNVAEGQKFWIEMSVSQATLGFASMSFTAKDFYDTMSKTFQNIASQMKMVVDSIQEAVEKFKTSATSFSEDDFLSRFDAGENILDIYSDLSENGTRSIQLFAENAKGQLNVHQEAKDFYQEQAQLIGAQSEYNRQQADEYGRIIQETFAGTGVSATLQTAFAGGARTLTADELKAVLLEIAPQTGETKEEKLRSEADLQLFKEFYNNYLDSSSEANDKAQELIEMAKEANELLNRIQKQYDDQFTQPSKDRLFAEKNLRALRNLQHSIDRKTGNVLFTESGEVNKISEGEFRALKEIDPSQQVATTLEEFDKLFGKTIQEGPADISTYTSVRPITYNTEISLDVQALDVSQLSPAWQRDLALTIKKEFETLARNFSGKD